MKLEFSDDSPPCYHEECASRILVSFEGLVLNHTLLYEFQHAHVGHIRNFGALLCIVNTYWSIAFIALVQLNYAIAPKIWRRK